MLKSDRWIKFQARQGMISPFEENQVSKCGVLSYGVSSYGYDLRLADELKIATNMNGSVIDPKRFDKRNFHDVNSKTVDGETFFILPPNSFALGRSMEYFNIPRNICVQCVGKSTYARCGIVVPATPLEPEWSGNVTLEFVNTTSLSVLLYVGEGVCQCLFFEGEECDQSYKDRGGKYQGQTGITLPR